MRHGSLACFAVLAMLVVPWAIAYHAASVATGSDAALGEAIAEGDVAAMARAVAAGAKVDGRDASGLSPLVLAVGHGRPDPVRWLLRAGPTWMAGWRAAVRRCSTRSAGATSRSCAC